MKGDTQQQQTKQESPRDSSEPKKGRWFFTLFTLAVLGGFMCVAAYFYLTKQSLPAFAVPQTSYMLDERGEVFDALYAGQNRSVVPLEDISPNLIHATLAIEDRRFYDHFGFDLKGIARAVWINLSEMDKVQGASTITQQLARNLYLTHDKTWTRKIKEAAYTVQLEAHLTKREILEQYLNQIYYGHSAYGIQSAARFYFGKDAKELTLAESAMLAGIPKGPRYYSPFFNFENAKNRQKTVLNAMVEEGYITGEQAEQAYREPLNFVRQSFQRDENAPYFRDYVRKVVLDKTGMDEKLLNSGGIRIFTTLDPHAQRIAEETIRKHIPPDSDLQVALVAIDPRTGYIKAMVGGRDYQKNQFNRALSNNRQPGSSFKAILYLAALENGFTPVTRFKSEPTVFTYDEGRKQYVPSNYGDHYAYDFIDLRQAIQQSDNIYAVHTIMEIGAEKVTQLAQRLGIESPLEPLPSLALGTSPVSPLEMAAAFAAIANGGIYIEPTAVLRVEDARNRVIYEASPMTKKAVEPAYAYVLTHLLESVFERGGTGYRVSSTLKRPVAAKTGTTDSDAWMVGFTPELAVAVWVGYDRGRMIGKEESYLAAPIFSEFIEGTLEAIPPKLFPIPDDVSSVYIDPRTGQRATENCTETRLEVFVKGTEPKETCVVHPSGKETPAPSPGKSRPSSWWEDFKRWWNGS